MSKKRYPRTAARQWKMELIQTAWQAKAATSALVYKIHKVMFNNEYTVAQNSTVYAMPAKEWDEASAHYAEATDNNATTSCQPHLQTVL